MDEDRPGQAGAGLELGEDPVDVVDVLGALDLGHDDDVDRVADLGDERRQVVEDPGTVEGVDPRPELGVLAEVGGLGDLDEPGARRLLPVRLDGVLEVAHEHVHRADHPRDLGRHLLVAGVEEVEHPARAGGYLGDRRRRPHRKGLEEVLGAAHGRQRSATPHQTVMTAVTSTAPATTCTASVTRVSAVTEQPPLNLSALLGEAMSKSGCCGSTSRRTGRGPPGTSGTRPRPSSSAARASSRCPGCPRRSASSSGARTPAAGS